MALRLPSPGGRVRGGLPLGLVDKARLAAEIVALRLEARQAMREADTRAIVERMRRGHPVQAEPVIDAEEMKRFARAVQRTLGPLPGDQRCLAQSLVLVGLLADRGVPSKLVIGVNPPSTRFEAHAWVEIGGRAALPQRGYTPLVEL